MSDSSALHVTPTMPATTGDGQVAEPFIDAMRGFAAVLVAYFHCRQVAWIGIHRFHEVFGFSLDPSVVIGYLTAPLAYGSAGVPVFFVISGYCIHRGTPVRLAADPSYRLDARSFWASRFARIYPVLFAALVLTLILDSTSLSLSPANHKILDSGPQAFFVNLFSLQGVLGSPYGSNGALWTLAIEVQFYAVYPLLVAARRRFGLPAVIAGVAVLNVASGVLLEPRCLILFTSYWFSWTLGGCLAEIVATPDTSGLSKRGRGLWQLAAIVGVALGCIAFTFSQYVAFQLWAIGFACFLRTMIGPNTKRSPHGLVMRLLARCGAFSYSLYAIHLPIFVCMQAILFRSVQQLSIWPSLVYMPVAILAAYALYQCVERPAMRWSARINRRSRAAALALAGNAGRSAARSNIGSPETSR
jgi:peptidoglycan/LPS O-acetylase OafA/YrhL